MSRGLSKLQKDILSALEDFQRKPERRPSVGGGAIENYIGDMARPRDLIRAMDMEATAANRAAISRSLARLESRGLITSYRPFAALPGHGSRYAKPPD